AANMKNNQFTSIITQEKRWFVAYCLELGVVSQGKTLEEAQANLKEAVELYIESFGDEDLPATKSVVALYPLRIPAHA
ncbi:MAG: type II toxin-antitoxin system HicB family antitoxin, partial [Calditrichota bacterium]